MKVKENLNNEAKDIYFIFIVIIKYLSLNLYSKIS